MGSILPATEGTEPYLKDLKELGQKFNPRHDPKGRFAGGGGGGEGRIGPVSSPRLRMMPGETEHFPGKKGTRDDIIGPKVLPVSGGWSLSAGVDKIEFRSSRSLDLNRAQVAHGALGKANIAHTVHRMNYNEGAGARYFAITV